MKSLLSLIKFVKPLTLHMVVAILCGTIGHLFAISIPTLGIVATLSVLGFYEFNVESIFIMLGIFSVLRGVFAYLEQQRNHYIAFTVLAIIRDKIFGKLRQLAPSKLDGKNRGNLISIITSDIELLEVFFAHTISPVAIAILVTLTIAGVLSTYHPLLAIISLTAHLVIGLILPIIRSKFGKDVYINYRNQSGELSGYYLDSLRGIDDVLQMQNGQSRIDEIKSRTAKLEVEQKKKAELEGTNNALSETFVFIFSGLMLFVSSLLTDNLVGVLVPTVIMMSSFGAVLSLNKLTVGLGATIACAKRVNDLLNEEPEVSEVINGKTPEFDGVLIKDLDFSYGEKSVLNNINLNIKNNKITSIVGKSGSGKSTLVKLIMRFMNSNGISISGCSLDDIQTNHLRNIESYMTQDSDIFASSIMENIRIGNLNATDEQAIEASKKASLHNFVLSLKNGYDTKVGELGDTLSGGEKQRIALARAFVHDGDLLILDESTSNLDSLNESIILKSIKNHNKATILISHRKSTLGISDIYYEVENGNLVVK